MNETTELYGIVNGYGGILGGGGLMDGKYNVRFKKVGEKGFLHGILVANDPNDLVTAQGKCGGTIVNLHTMKPVNMIECRYDEETEIVSWHKLGEARAICARDFNYLAKWCEAHGKRYVYFVPEHKYISGSVDNTDGFPHFDIKTRQVHN